MDTTSRRRLAAFALDGALDGTLDATWKPKTDKRVFSMAWDCARSSIFVGGQLRQAAAAGGTLQPRETVARFDPASGALFPWAIPTGTIELDQKAYDLAPTCTQLNVGYGGRNYAAALSLTNGDVGTLLWRVNTTGNVQTVEALGNLVIIGGHFTSVAGVTRVRVAALSMTAGSIRGPPRSRGSGVAHGRCS